MTKKKKPRKAVPLGSHALTERLKARYPAPEWVVYDEIPPGVGFDQGRRADALALSTWESRGLRLLGFEIKSSRADVLKELKDPEKAEAMAQYCDHWYLVLGRADLCGKDEVPPNWGLIVPHGTGLRVAKNAKQLKPKAWPRSFTCMLARRSAGTTIHDEERQKIRDEAYASARESSAWSERERKALEDKLGLFKKETGISIARWDGDQRVIKIGKIVNSLLSGGLDGYRDQLENLAGRATRLGNELQEAIDQSRPVEPM